jgi:predicted TIM-barrel fold metal-dependent hydrolase
MTIPNLLNDMHQHQIAYSVVLPIDYLDGPEHSEQLLTACTDVPEVIPFCSVHPQDPERIRKLRTYEQLGAKGVKLHPNFQQFRPDDPDIFDIYHFCSDSHVPLILHTGITGRERLLRWRKTFSAMEYISAIPRHFPELVLILAHAGLAQYEQAITLAQSARNVYLEISGQPAAHIRQAISAIGADRVLFGSDWPFWNQALALKAVQQATQDDVTATRCVLAENAASILQSRSGGLI